MPFAASGGAASLAAVWLRNLCRFGGRQVTQAEAEKIALLALGWIAGQDEVFQTFLGSTGSDLTRVRDGAEDPEFQAAVLDFLLMDDAWVIACAADQNFPPETLMRARAALPGGAIPHWT